MKKFSVLSVFFVFGFLNFGFSQTATQFQQIGFLLEDALLYSKQYLVPATDAAVYQASSAWMNSAKKKENWEINVGIHGNMFLFQNRIEVLQLQILIFNFYS